MNFVSFSVRLQLEMMRLRPLGSLDLRLLIGDLLLQSGQLRLPAGFNFRALRPVGELEKLDITPAIEEELIFLENQSENLLRLPRDGPGLNGQIASLSQFFTAKAARLFSVYA